MGNDQKTQGSLFGRMVKALWSSIREKKKKKKIYIYSPASQGPISGIMVRNDKRTVEMNINPNRSFFFWKIDSFSIIAYLYGVCVSVGSKLRPL